MLDQAHELHANCTQLTATLHTLLPPSQHIFTGCTSTWFACAAAAALRLISTVDNHNVV
jgi:hypothetical protein